MGTYSGGTGTIWDPYLISNVADWEELAATSADWVEGTYFQQTTDIDFTAANASSVGDAFAGVYDGNGKVMANITVDPTASNHSALFLNLTATAVLKDIIITDGVCVGSSSEADKSYTAMIAAETSYGSSIQDCTIIDCAVSNTHTAATFDGFVGGIAGANHGTVTRCRVIGGTVKGDITGGTALRLGGVTGYQIYGSTGENGKTEYCFCSAAISDIAAATTVTSHIGGIAGFIVGNSTTNGEVNYCTFNGSINYASTSGSHRAGGIVGEAYGPVTHCTNTGTLTSSASISAYGGGIVGQMLNYSSIDSCIAISNMTITSGIGTNYSGGLIGKADKDCTITNSSYIGTITAIGGAANIGGLIGNIDTGINAVMDSCSSDYTINTTLTGTEYLGGAIGFASYGAITNCIVKGIILNNGSASFDATTSVIGGFAGVAFAGTDFENCIAINGPWSRVAEKQQGFLGWDNGADSFSNCYWDTTVAGFITEDTNATGKTTTELQTVSTFDDFPTGGVNPKWLIEEGSYPELVQDQNIVVFNDKVWLSDNGFKFTS